MKLRDVIVFNETYQVPERVQRIDTKGTHGWQLRYGSTKLFSDHSNDGSGALVSLTEAVTELHRRIDRLPAPSGLRADIAARKSSDLPVGISRPAPRLRAGRKVYEHVFNVSVPRGTERSTNMTVYIGTDNTLTPEREAEALAKAIGIRDKAAREHRTIKTKARRAGKHVIEIR